MFQFMQCTDAKKRDAICAVAAKLFATRPFHKVRLDDIAAEARIGKATLYNYFDSKEDLYFHLIYDGFARLVDQLKACPHAGDACETSGRSPTQRLRAIIARLVEFAFEHPHFFELMRVVGAARFKAADAWNRKREELEGLICETIQKGNSKGEMNDPRPELTSLCIPGLVRSIMLFGPAAMDEELVTDQLIRMLENGIGTGERAELSEPVVG